MTTLDAPVSDPLPAADAEPVTLPVDVEQARATAEGMPEPDAPTAVEETAPLPGAEGEANDAPRQDVIPAAEPEKVGSRTITYEELLRHDERVRKAEVEVALCEREYESLKAEASEAKKILEKAIDKLRAVIRSNSPDADPLFNQQTAPLPPAATPSEPEKPLALEWSPGEGEAEGQWLAQLGLGGEVFTFVVDVEDGHWSITGSDADALDGFEFPPTFDSLEAAQAECQKIANKLWEAEHGLPLKPAEVPQDDNAWRAVPLDTLTPAIPPKKLALLAENNPPIVTIGDWQAWCEKKGEPWFWKDIKGLGEGGRDAMDAALMPFWESRQNTPLQELAASVTMPREPITSDDPPADDFEDKPIGHPELLAVLDKHLSVNVVQYTSGRWRSDYFVSVGSLDASRKLADAPSFPSKGEAGANAITAVREAMRPVRTQLKGKADKTALEITWALDAGEKSLSQTPRKTA